MKAAVLKDLRTAPVYENYDDPHPASDDEEVMDVKAKAFKNLDLLMASPDFYAHYKDHPVVVGTEAVGILSDGSRVYARGKGAFAEKMVVHKKDTVALPAELDWSLAAAVPTDALGSYLPLKVKVERQTDEGCLMNGGR